MFDPTDAPSRHAPSPFQLRQASMSDFAFAEALTRTNMGRYYERHHLAWRADLFLASWQESENFILEIDNEPIGVLRLTEEGDSLHIRDVQIAEGHRGVGAGTFLLETSHRWARERGLRELQLRVFVDNPAARLYLRMGYRVAGPRLAQLGAIRHMTRRV
ncbi:GNAT family N-acetyltransferase [Trinickia diaoshuihuensis]|jgi:GNAT superfamily N-acetyltransferase|uniref:GNAT family N-acetyltransferase n=1 Tax=Trinickia diaoshuihuensis TaxID=2292265 RepID=UPI000E23914A|nr:GNAT family N-acetyltransferase [Trinickia diaoshuihuensis]